MPKSISPEELISRMRGLPETLRSFLASVDVVGAIEEIQRAYGLTNSATIALSRAIAWYTTGLFSAAELGTELVRVSPQGKLSEFRGDVIKKIFIPFGPQLQAHGLNFEAIVISTTSTPSAIPPRPPGAPEKIAEKISPPPIIIGQAPPPLPVSPPPRPAAASRITIAPPQFDMPIAPAPNIPTEPQPETSPRAIRYAPPPVIRDVPKVISPREVAGAQPPLNVPPVSAPPVSALPAGMPQVTPPMPQPVPPPPPPPPPSPPPLPPPIPPPLKAPVAPQATVPAPVIKPPQLPKPQAQVIDLSTFKLTASAPPPIAPANPPSQQPQPKAQGNMIDLKQ